MLPASESVGLLSEYADDPQPPKLAYAEMTPADREEPVGFSGVTTPAYADACIAVLRRNLAVYDVEKIILKSFP
ncbi:hypothetical protein BaRGS_00015721 [Batillaria attramentaria]|uniref:Uncharacterized protein n=1 Tax=Batillaria attramentaria TaxID=370345 RepID=A0ABD0L0V8_9CAEN